jgi:hypothetical protein
LSFICASQLTQLTCQETQKVSLFEHRHQLGGRRIWLLDTPGFDDTNRSDSETLAELATWLGASYDHNKLLSGIIFLHQISESRLRGSQLRNLRMFKSLCGERGLGNVVLATTFWSGVTPEEGQRRERDLVQTESFWGHLRSQGSQIMRHDNGIESAEKIIGHLAAKHPDQKRALRIQREMRDGRRLKDTSAGRIVADKWKDQREEMMRNLKHFQKELERVTERSERAEKALYEREKWELERKLQESDEAKELLKQTKTQLQERKFPGCIIL